MQAALDSGALADDSSNIDLDSVTLTSLRATIRVASSIPVDHTLVQTRLTNSQQLSAQLATLLSRGGFEINLDGVSFTELNPTLNLPPSPKSPPPPGVGTPLGLDSSSASQVTGAAATDAAGTSNISPILIIIILLVVVILLLVLAFLYYARQSRMKMALLTPPGTPTRSPPKEMYLSDSSPGDQTTRSSLRPVLGDTSPGRATVLAVRSPDMLSPTSTYDVDVQVSGESPSRAGAESPTSAEMRKALGV